MNGKTQPPWYRPPSEDNGKVTIPSEKELEAHRESKPEVKMIEVFKLVSEALLHLKVDDRKRVLKAVAILHDLELQ